MIEALRAGLSDFGYVEDNNITLDFHWADGDNSRLPGLAKELVRDRVEVLITHGTPGTLAAKKATATVPIVMAVCGDAVAGGAVESLAKPGGNITGNTFFGPELAAKRVELLKECAQHLARAAVLVNPHNPISAPVLKAMVEVGARLDVVDALIKAAKPASLSVEEPTAFPLVNQYEDGQSHRFVGAGDFACPC
ncbi:MAG TPA: ABC transporter substrate-binding protein [Pseudolabrys sp.]|nr:ABC transporter substrate-binding protein [Pseudolabrys sp.]